MLETLRLYRANLKSVKNVLADGVYAGETFEYEVKKSSDALSKSPEE